MAATTTAKTGVTDSAPGAGVAEYLGLLGPLAALAQAVSIIPHGDPWQIKGSLSYTPTVITDTLPPSPVMAWKVPSGKALQFTGGVVHSLAATIEYYRVCRRYFLFGYQATAAPSAPAAPTTALLALTDGIGTSGVYSWKVAPLDTFDREGPLSAASSPGLTLTSTNRGATITPPALGAGVTGYNIYRTLSGGSTHYFVGTTLGAAAFLDSVPDSIVTSMGLLTPSATWAAGAIAGETADGPCEVIIEVGAVAITGAPTTIVYTDPYGTRAAVLATFPTTIGQRIRAKTFGDASTFVAVGVVAGSANLWRGPHSSDIRTRLQFDYGALAVSGVNAVPSAGSFIVWGQQVIGVGTRQSDPVLGTIHSYPIIPTSQHGHLIPPLGEIVVEVGALATGVVGVRDVTLSGLLLPTTAT